MNAFWGCSPDGRWDWHHSHRYRSSRLSRRRKEWPNLKYKQGPKIIQKENFCLITQPGDRLRLPETVHMIPGLAKAPGKTLAQGKEMQGSLDLLLLFLRESVELRQEDTEEEVLLRGLRISCYGVSWVTGCLISKRSAFPPHRKTQTMAKGSVVPSDLLALFIFCLLFCCSTPLSSACVIILSLEDRL